MSREISFPVFPLFSHLPQNRRGLNVESKEIMEESFQMGLQVGSFSCLQALPTVYFLGEELHEEEEEMRGAGFVPSWSRSEIMEGERKFHDDLSPNIFLKRQLNTFWNLISENNSSIVETGVYCRVVLYTELLGECFLRLKEKGMRGRFLIGGAGIGSLSSGNDIFYEKFAHFVGLILNNQTNVQRGTHSLLNSDDSSIVNAYFSKILLFFEKFEGFVAAVQSNVVDFEMQVAECKEKFNAIEDEVSLAFPFVSLVYASVTKFRSHFPNLPLPWILDSEMLVSTRSIIPFRPSVGIDPSFLPLAFETDGNQISHPFLFSDHEFSVQLPAKKRRKLIYALKGEEMMDPNIPEALRDVTLNVERDREDGDVASFERSIHCNFQFLLQFCADFQMKIMDFGIREGRRIIESSTLKEKKLSLTKEFSLIPVPDFLLFKSHLEDLKLREDSLFFSYYAQNVYFSSFQYCHLFSAIRIYRLFNWIEFWGMSRKEAYLLDSLNGLMTWKSAEKFFYFYRNNDSEVIGEIGTWIRTKLGTDSSDSFSSIESLSSFVNSGKAFILKEELDPSRKYASLVDKMIEFEFGRVWNRRHSSEQAKVCMLFPSEMVVSLFSTERNAFSVWKIQKMNLEDLQELSREEGWKERILIDYREERKLLNMTFGNDQIKARRVFNEGFFSFSVEKSVGSVAYRAFPSINGFESYSELMRNCVSEVSMTSSSVENFLKENKFGPGQGKWSFAMFGEDFPINTRVRLMISLSYLSMCCLLRGFNKAVILSRIFGPGLIGGEERMLGNPDLRSGRFRSLMYLQMQRQDGSDNVAYSISFPSMLDLSRNLAFYSISLRSISSEFEDFSSFVAQTGGSYQVFGYTNQSSKVFPICFGVGVLSFHFFPNPRSGVVPMAGSLPFPVRSEYISELKALGLDERQGVFDVSSWTKQILNAADPELIPYLPEGVSREDVVEKFVKGGKGTLEFALEGGDFCPFSFPSPKNLVERNAALFGGCCWFNAVILGLKDVFEHQIFAFDGAGLERFSNFIVPEKQEEMRAKDRKIHISASDFKFEDFYQALIVEWILTFRLKKLFSSSQAVSSSSCSSIYPYISSPLFFIQLNLLEQHMLSKKKISTKKEEEITLIGGRMNIEDQRCALDWLCLIVAGMFGYALQVRLREVKFKEDMDYLAEFSENGKLNLKKFSNSFSVSVSSGIKRKQALKKEVVRFEFPNLTSFRDAAHNLILNSDERVFCANVPIVEIKLMYLYQHVFNISSLQGSEQIFNFCVNLKKYFLFPDDNDEIGCYDLGYTNSVKDQLKWINDNFTLFCDRFLNQKYSSLFFSMSLKEKDAFQKSLIKMLGCVKKQYETLVDFSKGEEKEEQKMEEEISKEEEREDEMFSKIRVGVKGDKIPFIKDKIFSVPVNLDEKEAEEEKEKAIASTFALILDFETYISDEEEHVSSIETEEEEEEKEQEVLPSILEDDFGLANENVEEQKNGSLDDVLAFSSKSTTCGKVNIGKVIPYAFGLCSNRTMKKNNKIYLWMKEGGTIDMTLEGQDKKLFYFDPERMKTSQFDIQERIISWGYAFWCATFREVVRQHFFPIIKRKFVSDWQKFVDFKVTERKKNEVMEEELHERSWEEFILLELEGIRCDSLFSVVEIEKDKENSFGVIDPIPVYAHNGARFDFFFILKSAGFFDFIRILKHSGFIQIIAQANVDLFIPEILDRNGYTIFNDSRSVSFSKDEEKENLQKDLLEIFKEEVEIFISFVSEHVGCQEEDMREWIRLNYFPVEWKVKSMGKDMKQKNIYSNVLKGFAFSKVNGKGGKKKKAYKELLPAKRGFDGLFLSALKSIVLSFQDSYRIAPLPLRTLCSSYHCSVQKGIFPYSVLTEKLYVEKVHSFFCFFSFICGKVKRGEALNSDEDSNFKMVQNIQTVSVKSSDFSNGAKDLKEFREEIKRLDEISFGDKEKKSVLSLFTHFSHEEVSYPILLALVEYLINDVFGLEEVITKHCSALIKAFHCDPYRTLTLPSYAFKFLSSTNVLSDASFASSIPVDLFIRKGIKGGATMLTSHKFSLKENYLSWARKTGAIFSFPTNDEKDLEMLSVKANESCFPYYYPLEGEELDLKKLLKYYKTCATFGAISNLDVNSLYPSAMTMFPLPSGDAYWLGGERENLQVMDYLKAMWKELNFSAPLMVMCDFEYGKKNSMLPLIGEKRSPGKDVFASVPRMMYDFVPKTACVLSTPEIEILYRFYQGKITKIYGVIMFSEWTYSIGALIYEIYQKRLEFKRDKNPIELAYKLIMNSLYGKWIQQYPDTKLSIFDLKMNMSNLMDGFDSTLNSVSSIASHLFENDRNINSNWREFSYLCVSLFDTVRSMVFLSNGQCVVEQKMLKFNGSYSLNDSRIIPSGCKTSETAVAIPSIWGVYVLGNSKLIDVRYLSMLNQGDQIKFYEAGGSIQLGNGCYYMDTDSFHVDVRVLSSSLDDGTEMKEVDLEGKEYYGKEMRRPNVANCFKIGKELGNISSDIEIDSRTVEFFKANYEEEYLRLCDLKKSDLSPQESLVQFLLFKFFSGVPCYVSEGRYVATKTYCEQVSTLSIGDESKGQDKAKMYWGSKVHLRAKGINVKDIYSLIGSTNSKDILDFYSSLIENDMNIESHQMSFAAGTKASTKYQLSGYNVSKSQKSGRKWVSRPTIPFEFEGDVRNQISGLLADHSNITRFEGNEWISSILLIWTYYEESSNKFAFDVSQIKEFLMNIRVPYGWSPVKGSLMNFQVAQMTGNKIFNDQVETKKASMKIFDDKESETPAVASMMSVLNRVIGQEEGGEGETTMEEDEKILLQTNEMCKFLSRQGKFNFGDKDCPFVVNPNVSDNW